MPGATTLPGGYPVGQAVPGAGTLRLTRSGLDVLSASASSAFTLGGLGGVGAAGDAGAGDGGAATLSFTIPSSSTSGSLDALGVPVPYTVDVCPGGADATATPPTCALDVQVPSGSLHLDAVAPDAITLSGTVPVRLQDLPLDATLVGSLALGFGVGTCNGSVPSFAYGSFPFSVTLPLVPETVVPRAGITKVDAAGAVVTLTADPSALGVCGQCAAGDTVCQALLDTAKDLVFTEILSAVETQVKSALAPSFCVAPDTTVSPSCPTGSSAGAGSDGASVCLYDAAPATCVPTFFGTEGTIAASAVLGSTYAPANASPLDFLVAAGGALDPAPGAAADDQGYVGHTPNGVTLSLLGGINAETVSPCVAPIDVTPPANLPLPSALTVDTAAGWPSDVAGPHLGIAFAARYLDYALARTYQSGALCLDISTTKVQLLSTGLLSLLVPSLPSLTFEGAAAAIDVRVRPGAPPTVTLGSGADTGANSIVTVHAPAMAFDFYVFSDDEYLRAFTFTADATIPVSFTTGKTKANPAGGLAPVIGQIGFANPVVTNSALLTDAPATIATGIELALGTVVGQLFTGLPALDPSSSLAAYGLALDIPTGGVQKVSEGSDDFLAIFAALTPAATTMGKAPVGVTGARLLRLAVDPGGLALEGATRARLPTLSLRLTPADARPREYAWWLDDGTRSAWSTEAAPVITADALYLQGKHVLSVATRLAGEAASEGEPTTVPFLLDVVPPTVTFDGALHAWDIVSAPAALQARWQSSATADAVWSAWGTLAAAEANVHEAANVEVRDEAGNVASLAIGGVATSATTSATTSTEVSSGGGCSTGGGDVNLGDAVLLAAIVAAALVLRRRRALMVVAPLAGALVSCGGDNLDLSKIRDAGSDADASVRGCGADCRQTCLPALDEGVVGAYASLAAAPDGTVWVAAYSDAVITGASRVPYGDLVVGRYVAATGAVAWQTADGVPAQATGTCPDHDPDGWRGGVTDAGDDVGLFTSIAIDPSGQPMVAYFDSTHGALKLARFDGAAWTAHTVLAQAGLAVGRYAQLVIVGGVPVITYQAGTVGGGVSYVETIRATSAAPASATDWESPIIVDSEPGSPTTSVASDIPVADGDYLSVAPTPGGSYAFVYYDAVEKALFEADMPASGGWAFSPLAGGAQGGGDSGQDANLVIDASGDWHVVYVNADRGTLDYLEITGGATLTSPSTVDDGSGIGGQPFADGVHRVGAGAHLTVDASGVPRVYYGDATAGTLRVATGARSGTGASAVYKWTLAQVTQTGRFAGLFPWPLPDGSMIGNAYRSVDAAGETHGDFVFVAPP